jgi:hypothetical protein
MSEVDKCVVVVVAAKKKFWGKARSSPLFAF